MEIVNIDKSYNNQTPFIIIRKGDSPQSSLRFQIMNKNIPLDLTKYTVGFRGRDSIGTIVKENKVVVKDSKNGIIEVVLLGKDIKSLGKFQVAYLTINAPNVADTTSNINITVLESVEV